jgi:hypothetical protein
MTRSVRVRCSGRVLRVVREVGAPVGVVAMIDNYQFVPEANAEGAGSL